MSLDVRLMVTKPCEVYSRNITHNLACMAEAAGIYKALWRPEEMEPPISVAKDLIPILRVGLDKLISNPDKYRKHNPPNGWGTYESLLSFVTSYLGACQDNPDAAIEVCR